MLCHEMTRLRLSRPYSLRSIWVSGICLQTSAPTDLPSIAVATIVLCVRSYDISFLYPTYIVDTDYRYTNTGTTLERSYSGSGVHCWSLPLECTHLRSCLADLLCRFRHWHIGGHTPDCAHELLVASCQKGHAPVRQSRRFFHFSRSLRLFDADRTNCLADSLIVYIVQTGT